MIFLESLVADRTPDLDNEAGALRKKLDSTELSAALKSELRERIELFKAHGIVREEHDELFRSTSWQSVFEGMGIRPAKYSPRVDNIELAQITEKLALARSAILNMVKTLPTHDEYLDHRFGER